MKGRSFLISLGITILLLVFFGFGIWKLVQFKSPLKIQNEALEIPKAGKYFQKTSPLTIHLKLDLNELPEYLEKSIKKQKKKKFKEEVINIRNGLFSLSGNNFEKDLSTIIGNNISFSISQKAQNNEDDGWVLAIEGSTEESGSIFLEKFLQRQSQKENEISFEEYKKIKIITVKSKLLNNREQEISTSVPENNMILIASNSNIIKQAIDASNDKEINQFENQELKDLIEKIDDGIGLIYASPEGLKKWFDLPEKFTEDENLKNFISSVKIEDLTITIDSIFQFKENRISEKNGTDIEIINDSKSNVLADDFAIINGPSELLKEDSTDPQSKILKPLIEGYLDSLNAIAVNLITRHEKGPLVWINSKQGWLIGSSHNLEEKILSEALGKEDYMKSSTNLEGEDIDIWSRLTNEIINESNDLKTEVAIIHGKSEAINWWSQNINLLNRSHLVSTDQKSMEEIKNFYFNNDFVMSQFISLGKESAQKGLGYWKPWVLMKVMTGDMIEKNVKHLSISIGIPENELDPSLNVRTKLSLG